MSEDANSMPESVPVEQILRDELEVGNVVLGTIGPIVGHLVASHDPTLFDDEIVASIRGMVAHISTQLLAATAEAGQFDDPQAYVDARKSELAGAMSADEALVRHCHALGMEWRLTKRLQARSNIDPVLSPMVQELVASSDATTASTAMSVIVAQARFAQHMQRMELPVAELPNDLRGRVFEVLRHTQHDLPGAVVDAAENEFARADSGGSRSERLSRLLESQDADERKALQVSHGGVALFLTALAELSGQSRDLATVSTSEAQLSRLALALRAGGLKPDQVEQQFLTVHPEVTLPEGFDTLRMDEAARILAGDTGAGA